MADRAEQFLEKLNSGPREVYLYFFSNLNTEINRALAIKYGLDTDIILDLTEDFFVSDFSFSQLRKNVQNNSGLSTKINEFICDFLGKLFLPVADSLNIKVAEEIKFNKGKISDYEEDIENYNDFLAGQSFEIFNDLAEDFEKIFDANEEERIVISFLSENILEILSSTDNLDSLQMNGSLIYLLLNKKDSLAKFSRALLSNNELLSKNRILLGGKEQEASVSNLIKHFIEKNGSGMFSSIALAKYLSSPEISSILSQNEKKLLRKVLKVYYNLVFFPDSMANLPINEWEIFPVEDLPLSSPEQKDFAGAESINKMIDLSKKTEEVPDFTKEKSDLTKSIKQVIDSREKEIKILKELLQKYPKKSLEKKAIESELEKIEKDKN